MPSTTAHPLGRDIPPVAQGDCLLATELDLCAGVLRHFGVVGLVGHQGQLLALPLAVLAGLLDQLGLDLPA